MNLRKRELLNEFISLHIFFMSSSRAFRILSLPMCVPDCHALSILTFPRCHPDGASEKLIEFSTAASSSSICSSFVFNTYLVCKYVLSRLSKGLAVQISVSSAPYRSPERLTCVSQVSWQLYQPSLQWVYHWASIPLSSLAAIDIPTAREAFGVDPTSHRRLP